MVVNIDLEEKQSEKYRNIKHINLRITHCLSGLLAPDNNAYIELFLFLNCKKKKKKILTQALFSNNMWWKWEQFPLLHLMKVMLFMCLYQQICLCSKIPIT